MARLQDFQTVTPTSSDKLLVVQSQGQGLVPYGSKLDSANPTGTGSLSLNRTGTTGTQSATLCRDCEASGPYSLAEGYATKSKANSSHSEGYETEASGNMSHSEGMGTIAKYKAQHVFGEYNIADPVIANPANRGTYIEIVGKGTADNNRSNARTLDWSGNEVLAGGLKINNTETVKAIKKETRTATTDSMGLISLGTYATARTALVACSSQAASSGIYYLFQLFTFSGIWHARVTKSNDGSIAASTQITFDYYYIDAT